MALFSQTARIARRTVSFIPILGGWSDPPWMTAKRGSPFMKRWIMRSRSGAIPALRSASSTSGRMAVMGCARLIEEPLNWIECIFIQLSGPLSACRIYTTKWRSHSISDAIPEAANGKLNLFALDRRQLRFGVTHLTFPLKQSRSIGHGDALLLQFVIQRGVLPA